MGSSQTDPLLDRRGFLALAGAAALGKLAGCSSVDLDSKMQNGSPKSSYSPDSEKPKDYRVKPTETSIQYIDLLEPISWQPKLLVNRGKNRTGRRGTEEDGIDDMKRLCLEEEDEEAWIYLPQAEVWVEVGEPIPESEMRAILKAYGISAEFGRSVSTDVLYIDNLIKKNGGLIKEIRHWHTHPINENKGFQQAVYSTLPSDMDLVSGTRNLIGNIRQNPYWPQFSKGVRSAHGATRHWVTEAGKSYFFDMDIPKMVEHAKSMESSIEGFTMLPSSLSGKNLETPEVKAFFNKNMRNLCSAMSTKYIKLEFIEDE